MGRRLQQGSLALVVAVALLLGCRSQGKNGADAGADAGDAAAAFDANLPETVVTYLDAGPAPTASSVPPIPLPRPCVDKTLGTVSFVQDGEKVVILSSKGIARASCVRLEEWKLLCDWVDKDGKPTLTRKAVTYAPKAKIGGSYDAKHAFSCPPQDPAKPAPLVPSGRKEPKKRTR